MPDDLTAPPSADLEQLHRTREDSYRRREDAFKGQARGAKAGGDLFKLHEAKEEVGAAKRGLRQEGDLDPEQIDRSPDVGASDADAAETIQRAVQGRRERIAEDDRAVDRVYGPENHDPFQGAFDIVNLLKRGVTGEVAQAREDRGIEQRRNARLRNRPGRANVKLLDKHLTDRQYQRYMR